MAVTLEELKGQLGGLEEYTPASEGELRQRAEDIYSPQYQQDLAALRESLQAQLNQQQRSAISSGMQRSSYNQAALSGIRGAALRSEASLAAAKEGNIANLILQLMESDKDRATSADQYRNQLLMQLYEYGGSGSGSGSGGGTTNAQTLDDYIKQLFGSAEGGTGGLSGGLKSGALGAAKAVGSINRSASGGSSVRSANSAASTLRSVLGL